MWLSSGFFKMNLVHHLEDDVVIINRIAALPL
jgi:hypothetical protein